MKPRGSGLRRSSPRLRRLGGAVAVGDAQLATLASLGIQDAEQLVAIAAIPEVREELEAALGVDSGQLKRLIDSSQRFSPPERAALRGGTCAPRPRAGRSDAHDGDDCSCGRVSHSRRRNAGRAAGLHQPDRIHAANPQPGTARPCVAFTLTALNEYILRRRGISQNLSEQHLYFETKQIDGSPNACGTWQAKAVLVLRRSRRVPRGDLAVQPNPPCNNHGALPAQARPNGCSYRLPTLAAVHAERGQLQAAHVQAASGDAVDSGLQQLVPSGGDPTIRAHHDADRQRGLCRRPRCMSRRLPGHAVEPGRRRTSLSGTVGTRRGPTSRPTVPATERSRISTSPTMRGRRSPRLFLESPSRTTRAVLRTTPRSRNSRR